MSIAISVDNISKLYRLGEIGTGSLAHDVNRWWHKARGKEDPYLTVGQSNDRTRKGDSDYVYALRDISFEVKQGEVLGIIGRNGAGKSTLLKILSRVTTPTTGQIKVKGRIASLLEVGTGFHPELTGRENIYLNGAILGMRKAEIKTKFDEIVEFSGCERYIDTPVKRYSSGMYVRLAFAVAAHLEPETLIVDEVLAVGDAEFQKKCLGKMKDVAGQGRTVIFVSHNMAAVVSLCDTAIWLREGRLHDSGQARDLANKYMNGQEADSEKCTPLSDRSRSGTGLARFTKLTISSCGGPEAGIDQIVTGSSVRISVDLDARSEIKNTNVAVTIYDVNSYRVIDVNTALRGDFVSMKQGETITVNFLLDSLLLKPGRYIVELWLGRGGTEDIDFVREAGVFEVCQNITETSHSEVFPGIYQCRFSHEVLKISHDQLSPET